MTSLPANPDASVVVCCYDLARLDDVRRSIASVLAMEGAPELVVVVDHNHLLLGRLSSEFPEATVVPNVNAKGLSGARNTGIAATLGRVVAFLDDDAAGDPDMVSLLLAAIDQDPDVLGTVGTIAPEWTGGLPSWFPAEFLWVVGCTYRGMRPGPVRNLIGAGMAIRRDVFDRAGVFDEGTGRTSTGLPLGCEETELCIRAGRAFPTGRFLFVPEARCRHNVVARRGTWAYFVRRCYAEGLSKARISTLDASAQSDLSTERAYVRRTLPLGVLKGLADAARGDGAGLLRAFAIVLGLGVTTAGYAKGRLSHALPVGASRPTAMNPSMEG